MTYILTEKINIGVSACNFGALVRYNRKGWDRIGLLAREKDAFIWTPVCPEAMSGLGVPREPMKLVGGNGDDFWAGKARAKNKKGRDVSSELRAGAESCLAALRRAGVDAFCFMEGSPSCGVYRTTLKNQSLGKPPGVFGSLLLKENYFLIPVIDLDSPLKWWDWRRRLHAFIWLKRADLPSKKAIYDIWHEYKFLCQELSDREARAIGRELAALPAKPAKALIEDWRSRVLLLLRRPVPENRIRFGLNKHCAYLRHRDTASGTACVVPQINSGKRAFVDAVLAMEKQAIISGQSFISVPVLYRGR